MPARRLPRTDDERSAAMNTCNVKYQATAAPLRLITATQFGTLGATLSPWRNGRDALGPLLVAQTSATGTCGTAFATCVRFNSHFIQVLNFAIERGEIPASARAFYELPVSHAQVPSMTTVADALRWATAIEVGEIQRTAAGGAPLSWPSAAQVATAANALEAADSAQSIAKDGFDYGQEAVAGQRTTVDALVKDLWDTIEYNLRGEELSSLRRKAREWGVVYDGEEEEAPTPPPVPPGP